MQCKLFSYQSFFYTIFVCLSFFCQNTFAQKKINTKKVAKIKKQLNELNIAAALNNLEQLVESDPYSPYYTELQINILKQLIDKIKYAKDESDETIQTSYLDANNKLVADTIDWENESDTVMLQFIKPTQTQTKPGIAADTNKNNQSKKKKKKWFEFDDSDAPSTVTVTIDSGLIKTGDATEVKEETTSTVTAENVDNMRISTPSDGMPTGFEKTKSKAQKQQEAMQQLINTFTSLDTKVYQKQLIACARKSTLWVEYADSGSKFLREILVDTALSKKRWKDSAVALIESGDEHFIAKEFEEALTDYNSASIIEPTMVAIYLKMGDAYFYLNEDSMGREYFKAALQLDTITPNTHFHIAQHYFAKGDYKKALDKVIDAIIVYPDRMFFDMIKNIADKTANDYNSQWIPRLVYPINTRNKYEEIMVDDTNPWYWYQSGKMDFGSYANDKGILRYNELTNEKYLEVACFLKMLDSAKDTKELKFARDLRKIGYLDCYIFLNLFHVDIYPQFKDFASTHAEKIRLYMYILLNWHKRKFDAVKKEPTLPADEKKPKGKRKK
jgi:tetratricopeptide (TPR) repeat protein